MQPPEVERAETGLADALTRIAAAASEDGAIIALGEALDWVHKLEDWHRKRLVGGRYFAVRDSRQDGQTVGGLIWARNFDHHELVTTAAMGDRWTDYWHEMFGVLVWRIQLPPPSKPVSAHGRDIFYAKHLADHNVLETLVAAQEFFTYIRGCL